MLFLPREMLKRESPSVGNGCCGQLVSCRAQQALCVPPGIPGSAPPSSWPQLTHVGSWCAASRCRSQLPSRCACLCATWAGTRARHLLCWSFPKSLIPSVLPVRWSASCTAVEGQSTELHPRATLCTWQMLQRRDAAAFPQQLPAVSQRAE